MDDQLYAIASLDSYSAYFVQYVAEKKDAGNNIPVFIVVGAIALLAVGMLVVMSRKH